jgi:hypothetical protein
MTDDESQAIAAALKSARACLSGQIGAVEACWILSGFAINHERLLPKKDSNLFIGILSETDALPVGTLKDEWHPDFLPAKMEQLAQYEARVTNDVRDACGRLITALEARAAKVESQ